MFSGIVETTALITSADPAQDLLRIQIERPASFSDLHRGDSICVDGVCLTVEEFSDQAMAFSLGPETLKVTGWTAIRVAQRRVNLERSLRLEDRIHGHLVTGHVDTQGTIRDALRRDQTLDLTVEFGPEWRPLIWPKGSVAINGVSLTINRCEGLTFSVGLIPETLIRTGLGGLQVGDPVNLEFDNMARGLIHWARLQQESL